MWRCPRASGTPFITPPRAKKKFQRSAQESRPKQNLLVHPRAPPHRQVDPVLPTAAATLGRAAELIDAKSVTSSWNKSDILLTKIIRPRFHFLGSSSDCSSTLIFPVHLA